MHMISWTKFANMGRRILLTIGLLSCAWSVWAQDLNCEVTVDYTQIENTDAARFQNLEQNLREFVNNQKWTREVFKENERIELSLLLTLNSETPGGRFSGSLQIQSRRPVFNSSYYTPIINHKDENISFVYQQFDVLQFVENNAAASNLTAIIAYYVYLTIGLDYETFGMESGTPYLQTALNIANQNISSNESGWKPSESQINRYWIIENYLEARFKNLRKCMYMYHRGGLDNMSENPAEARKSILNGLRLLESVHRNLPNSINLRMFFNAKADEIVNIFKEAEPGEKAQVVQLLSRIDPASIQKWSRIQ